ncbi:glycosyltransferase family 2 protein [Salipiger marinus]|uniref:glycosyltransferase family 2 protein n=1 Tax=Salipiger marinus TaxID=555512 RepID=UPI002CA1F494|nr:glycosyltransferase family 2 protein [Salipiger manganoxidans]MEB3421672.1 glycosyltransferase family 2 protein [Salipiger manganoxidans]
MPANHPSRPLLSIITIMRNAHDGFLRTADSVVASKPDWCEWIVIDGGSTDGTLERVASYRSSMQYFVSEPDEGIADAFNKGIARSTADYVLFLNAGDELLPNVYVRLGPILSDPRNAPAIVGQIRMNGRYYGRPIKFWRQFGRNYLPHQAMLIRRSLFRLLGNYDVTRRFGMDYEWSLRLKSRWSKIWFVPLPISDMEAGGISMTNYEKTFASYHQARLKNCPRHQALSKILEKFFVAKVKIGRVVRGLSKSLYSKLKSSG